MLPETPSHLYSPLASPHCSAAYVAHKNDIMLAACMFTNIAGTGTILCVLLKSAQKTHTFTRSEGVNEALLVKVSGGRASNMVRSQPTVVQGVVVVGKWRVWSGQQGTKENGSLAWC